MSGMAVPGIRYQEVVAEERKALKELRVLKDLVWVLKARRVIPASKEPRVRLEHKVYKVIPASKERKEVKVSRE